MHSTAVPFICKGPLQSAEIRNTEITPDYYSFLRSLNNAYYGFMRKISSVRV